MHYIKQISDEAVKAVIFCCCQALKIQEQYKYLHSLLTKYVT